MLYLIQDKSKMSYFHESFEYQPIKLFLNSNSADNVRSHGDVTFNLRKNICLPSGTIGYVSLNELTIPNTNTILIHQTIHLLLQILMSIC